MGSLQCITGTCDRFGGRNHTGTPGLDFGNASIDFSRPRLLDLGVVRQAREQAISEARPFLGGELQRFGF